MINNSDVNKHAKNSPHPPKGINKKIMLVIAMYEMIKFDFCGYFVWLNSPLREDMDQIVNKSHIKIMLEKFPAIEKKRQEYWPLVEEARPQDKEYLSEYFKDRKSIAQKCLIQATSDSYKDGTSVSEKTKLYIPLLEPLEDKDKEQLYRNSYELTLICRNIEKKLSLFTKCTRADDWFLYSIDEKNDDKKSDISSDIRNSNPAAEDDQTRLNSKDPLLALAADRWTDFHHLEVYRDFMFVTPNRYILACDGKRLEADVSLEVDPGRGKLPFFLFSFFSSKFFLTAQFTDIAFSK